MTLDERLRTLTQLGQHLLANNDEYLAALQQRTEFHNGWFTQDNQRSAVQAIASAFLDEAALRRWLADYPAVADAPTEPRFTVGLVLAGNIPLVGFHDLLCVYVAGHRSQIKLSSKDEYVLPYLLQLLARYDARAADYFEIVPMLKGFDAVIATGSDNSARYFEAYFGKYPHIIRKNRNAVAVLSGQESEAELRALGDDVFQYFGLGCRNVAKLYVPQDYDFQPLLEVFHEWKHLQNHSKWKNNFDYNYALTTLNKESFHLTGPLMLLEYPAITSRIATLHFTRYADLDGLAAELLERREEIQLVVAQPGLLQTELPTFPFGAAQRPGLGDYADGVDTLGFLLEV
ncbi:acyl-CoA reductase [Neolewinella lacunae]|uniref:Acyl-CoA reductase n=1 Tax=Neolewinella lacunae TaxID=1517758 RepID=A0A923T7V5_9BACT|nr:acyl-CoA reductase [Neolewinella lacunae]MBC6993911.1 acyl-CoA reductase [Neolewinella lacunae]MDN3635007.1 acyl-CoA reductase [Neolewinella lacunae]